MDPCRGRRPITPEQGQCVDGTKVLPIPWSPFVGTTGRELKGAAGAESPVPAKALAAGDRVLLRSGCPIREAAGLRPLRGLGAYSTA